MAEGSAAIVTEAFAALLDFLGVEPQAKKVWFEGGFAKRLQLLGVKFVLDAEQPYVEVPQDKVDKTVAAIDEALQLTWVPAQECQRLLGLLVFHGRVLLSGKWHLPFTVRSLAKATVVGVVHMHAKWHAELVWWRTLLTEWNQVQIAPRRSIMLKNELVTWDQEPLLTPMTDASRSKQKLKGAAGAMFGVYYQAWKFDKEEVLNLDIMELEGLALVVWLRYLCSEPKHLQLLRGKRFVMRCDNQAFVKVANDRQSTYPAMTMLLGELHRMCGLHSFDVTLVYIKSKDNVGADALSRDSLADYEEWMSSEFGTCKTNLIRVPVQTDYRNWLASTMIACKR